MFKQMNKPIAIACAAALVISVSSAALAAGPSKCSQKSSGKVQTTQTQSKTSNPGSQGLGNGKTVENKTANKSEQVNNRIRSREENDSICGVNCKAVDEAIAALSEDDADTLSTYISDYEAAVAAMKSAMEDAEEGEDLSAYREDIQTTLQALIAAAETDGIELPSDFQNHEGPMNWKTQDGKTDNGMHFGAVANAIAALSEDDAETLSTYISAYEAAVAAMKSASGEDEDTSAYRTAVQDALQDLLNAAGDDGIYLVPVFQAKGNQMNKIDQDGKEAALMNCKDVTEAIAALSEDDADTLSTFISDYEAAVAAMKSAMENTEEDIDLSTYRTAVQTTLQALLDAAGEAEIVLFPSTVVE